MEQETSIYEEWLTTIVNTRLIFNTTEEFEDFIDNHSIHNNSIKKCFTSPQKMRAAFTDLQAFVSFLSQGSLNLSTFMTEYEKASSFFSNNLARRTHPKKTADEILRNHFMPHTINGHPRKKADIYRQIEEQNIDIAILIMMLMKALPGYESKNGDLTNFEEVYEDVIKLLDNFTSNGTIFESLPLIKNAREDDDKTRIVLYYYVYEILNNYKSFSSSSELYNISEKTKKYLAPLNIEGFWNEDGGKLKNTQFWQIVNTIRAGIYFAIYWEKDEENRLKGTKYELYILQDEDRLIFYLAHPKAIKHQIEGRKLTDEDSTWYGTNMLDTTPDELPLQTIMPSKKWPQKIHLTRCTDENVVSQYERWLDNCKIEQQFKQYDYYFEPNIYAITKDHLYIPTESDGVYYKIPKSAHECFGKIHIDDNVGLLRMNNKSYITFSDMMLYISTSDDELDKYGIERVGEIE